MFKFIDINLAIRKPAPDRISLSLPKCMGNDFYEIVIKIPALNWELRCKSKENSGYSGYLWVDDLGGSEATVLTETLKSYHYQVKIIHYKDCYQFKYNSKTSFLANYLFQLYRLSILGEKLSQTIFNKRTLIRSERMECLQYIAEKTVEIPNYITSSVMLCGEIHSTRWLFHPQKGEILRHHVLLLDSLVESGELKKENHGYKVTGKALATLSEFEKEQQKHHDNLNAARTAHSLTKALILVGVLNGVIQLYMWYHK